MCKQSRHYTQVLVYVVAWLYIQRRAAVLDPVREDSNTTAVHLEKMPWEYKGQTGVGFGVCAKSNGLDSIGVPVI